MISDQTPAAQRRQTTDELTELALRARQRGDDFGAMILYGILSVLISRDPLVLTVLDALLLAHGEVLEGKVRGRNS